MRTEKTAEELLNDIENAKNNLNLLSMLNKIEGEFNQIIATKMMRTAINEKVYEQ